MYYKETFLKLKKKYNEALIDFNKLLKIQSNDTFVNSFLQCYGIPKN